MQDAPVTRRAADSLVRAVAGRPTSQQELERVSLPQLIATWGPCDVCKVARPRTCAFALSCPSPLSSPASVCTSSLSRCRSLQKDLGGSRCFPAPLHPASALGRAGTVGVEGRVLGTAFALGASKCPLPFCGREGKTQLPAPGAQPGPKPGPPPPPARCGWQSRTNTNKPRLFHFPCPHQSEEQIHVFGHSWVTGLLGTETPSF